jgi:cysteinyl-tRNA synthetase
VRIDDEKMSKSLGNFFTVREILKLYQGEEIRYFVLASHYRSPLNFSDQLLDAARAALTRLYNALRGLNLGGLDLPAADNGDDEYVSRFNKAMDDDFNTPEAIAVLFDMASHVNKLREQDKTAAEKLGAELKKLANVLGLLEDDPETYLQGSAGGGDDVEKIETLIQQRLDARVNKDWAEADRIRDELKDMRIELEDKDGKTIWRRS